MRIGVRLSGEATDVAALAILADALPRLVEEPWTAWLPELEGASLVAHPALDLEGARRLVARGLPMVGFAAEGEGLRLVALSSEGEDLRWSRVRRREAPTLAEALRPARLAGDPLCDEALFVMRPDSVEPRELLRRLLLLERGDALICELHVQAPVSAGGRGGGLLDALRARFGRGGASAATGPEGSIELFAVKVRAPPLYLLMRARDGGAADEVEVYARDGQSALWVAWGHAHPLAGAAAAQLARSGQMALVDRQGNWLRGPVEWRTRSIYDALLPELDARREVLHVEPGERRFRITLRLAAGPLADPELWLLDPDQLLALEPLIASASGDELGRLTIARLSDGRRARYLLRERVRPGVPRLGARISESLEVAGFARVAGADNLYLPVGRRLSPMLRRDDLRRLLGLDEAHTVIVAEDRDGPQIITAPAVDEAPLQRWIDYVATDRRLALDELLERSVFEFPEATIEWPEIERSAPQRPPPRERRPRARPERPQPIAEDPTEAEEAAPQVDDEGARLRALRAEAREIERALAVGGVDDPDPWARLGAIRLDLGELDEATPCLEVALLHRGAPPEIDYAGRLADAHLALIHRERGPDLLMELVVTDRPTAGESAALGALLIERMAAGAPPSDEVMQIALPLFADPRLPVPRRLAWSVLAAWYGHSHDRLGITRAKEAILGGLNERGLSELHDLPRFVRHALALEPAEDDEAAGAGERAQQSQLVALEALWREAEAAGLPELDAHANFTRLIFAVGFARLGARASANEIIARIDEEVDVHEAPNRALFRLYMARLAHESSGGSEETWAAEVGKQLDAVRGDKPRKAVAWLQRRSLWLRTAADEGPRRRPTYGLPEHLDPAELAEHLAREMAPESGNFDYVIADAVDACLGRALASGSEALIGEVLEVAERGLEVIDILGHRAEAVGACIRAAGSLGDDALVGRLLDQLIEIARSPRLGTVHELVAAVQRGLVALRRFGGLEPARGLVDALARVDTYTAAGTIELLSTVAIGLVQLGEEGLAEEIVDTLISRTVDGTFDYVSRCQAGLAVAGALRHWPNLPRIERCTRILRGIAVFRDTFTTNRYYETHKIMILEAIVDSLADAQTRQSDRIQGFLDLEEHALRRRIIADWSALCGP
ncbi:MAG: hypothetical protein H6711_17920 [Myxococcales bacterium]|nr:hypothetical protein [Myxococcales bacterium]